MHMQQSRGFKGIQKVQKKVQNTVLGHPNVKNNKNSYS